MCERSFPELSNDIYKYGATLGYYILNPGKDNEVQIPMNYDYPREQDPFNEDWYTWQEYYTFDFMPGSIAFYVHYSDFDIDIRPERQEFRIVLLN